MRDILAIVLGILLGLSLTSCSVAGKVFKKKKKVVKVETLADHFETLDSLFVEGFDVVDTRVFGGETIIYLSKEDVNLAFSERYGILN